MKRPLSSKDRERYAALNPANIEFLMERYNRVNRWVIADMLRRSAHHDPDKTALVFEGASLTYVELDGECNRVANGLIDLGIEKYDRVAILAHNTIHHVLTWMGCAKAGAVYLALNYLLKGKDLAYCLDHSESKVLIVEDALYDLVKDVLDGLSTVRTLIWSDQGGGAPRPDDRFAEFDAWCAAYPATEPATLLRIEDPCQLVYTSGTESRPKGVILSNQALLAQYMACILDGGFEAGDINVNALPIYHCAARDVFMNPIFWLGGTNILIKAEIETILRTLSEQEATMFFAPPTVWIGMLRHPDFDAYDLFNLRKCYFGASAMPVEVLKEMFERLPGPKIYSCYGQTELAPLHTILKADDIMGKPGSVGRPAINMETRLEDEDGKPVEEPGVAGEICGRGPHALTMYFKEPDKTEEVMKGGWFHSGDIGVLDEERYLSVVDRKKDMVKTGGENVASREVEEAIYRDHRVQEVAVVGLPHAKWVEAVTALVVPRTGAAITEGEIIAHCRDELAPFKVPKKAVIVDELPKSPTGKILKRQIRQAYQDLYRET